LDIDLATPGLARIVGSDPRLDTIAHGLYFGEGPVWDRRNKRFLWTDIIGDTIWQWRPGVGKQTLIHPSSHANGMTFDREGRLVVAGWSARTIWRGEADGARDHRLPLPGKEVQQSERYRRAFRRQRILDGLGRRTGDSRHGG
jgi:gluconolactonase